MLPVEFISILLYLLLILNELLRI